MLTIKFYAGGDDAPPRLPVRVLSSVTDVRMTDEDPPRLVYSLPSPGLVSRGRDDVSYLPLSDLGPVEVFNAAGVSLAVLNAGPEVLTLPSDFRLTAEEMDRMRTGGAGPGYRCPETWPVALTQPGVIDTVGGYPALALALQKEGYSFGSLTEGFGWWFGKWAEAAARGTCGAAETLRQAIIGAEEHYRDAAEREPGEVGAAMRTRAETVLKNARYADSLAKPRALRARHAPLDTPTLTEERQRSGLEQGISAEDPPGRLPQALVDAGYTLQRSETGSNAWRWRKGEAFSDWFNGDDSRDRCIAELTRHVFGKACGACSEKVGQPHHSTCPYADFLGDTVKSDAPYVADLDAELNAQVDRMTARRIALIVASTEPLTVPEGFDAVFMLGSALTGHRFDTVYLSLKAALALASDRDASIDQLRGWVREILPYRLRPQPEDTAPGSEIEDLTRPLEGTNDTPEPKSAEWGALRWAELLIVQLPADHDGRNSWLLNHGRDEEAVRRQDERAATDAMFAQQLAVRRGETPPPLPAPVSFSVNGETYETTPGTRSGKALYDRVGGLSGMMLVGPDGKFVGDTDLVDIRGGEYFTTTPYRDPILRPDRVVIPDPALSIVSAEVDDKALNIAVQAPEGHVVVMLNGLPKAVDPSQVSFVDDLWRVLQLSPTSGLKVNKPGQVTRPLPDPNAAYKLEHGDAFESYLCERRFSGAEAVSITVDGASRLLPPGEYTRQEIDVLFGCGGWDVSKNGVAHTSGGNITVAAGDSFATDIPF